MFRQIVVYGIVSMVVSFSRLAAQTAVIDVGSTPFAVSGNLSIVGFGPVIAQSPGSLNNSLSVGSSLTVNLGADSIALSSTGWTFPNLVGTYWPGTSPAQFAYSGNTVFGPVNAAVRDWVFGLSMVPTPIINGQFNASTPLVSTQGTFGFGQMSILSDSGPYANVPNLPSTLGSVQVVGSNYVMNLPISADIQSPVGILGSSVRMNGTVSATIPHSLAAHFSWNNFSGGSFASGANWTGGTTPGVSETALFEIPGRYSVTLPGSTSIGNVSVNRGDVTFSAGSATTLSTNQVLVSGGGGAIVATNVSLAASSAMVSGTATVDVIGQATIAGSFIFQDSSQGKVVGSATVADLQLTGSSSLMIDGTFTSTGNASASQGSRVDVGAGGLLSVSRDLAVEDAAIVRVLEGGSVDVGGTVMIASGAELQLGELLEATGGVTNNGLLSNDFFSNPNRIVGDVTNDGLIMYWSRLGSNLIEGDLVQSSVGRIELRQTFTFFPLTVTGDIDLSGIIEVEPNAGLFLQRGNLYPLIDGGGAVNLDGLQVRRRGSTALQFVPVVVGSDLYARYVVPEASTVMMMIAASFIGSLAVCRRWL